MKQFFFGVLLISCWVQARSQQDHFIFIQDVSRQPFYARLGGESHSSSAGGHLILASLSDSVYNLFVGFPGNRQPEQLFTVDIGGRDRGFELQRHTSGWQLFDLQALTVVKPAPLSEREGRPVKKEDAYSRLMAGVVDDTTVLYTYVPDSTVSAAAPKASPAPGSGAASTARPAAPDSPGTASPAPANAAAHPSAGRPVVQSDRAGVPSKPVDANTREVGKANKTTQPELSNDRTAVVQSDITNHLPAGETTTSRPLPVTQPVSGVPAPSNAPSLTTDVAPPVPILDSRDIIRYRTENQREGKLFIYVDRSTPVADTIRLIIPRL